MDTSTILSMVKARLGITTAVRDNYLLAIIEGVLKELEDEKGLVLDGTNPYHLMFIVDYVVWRYQSRDSDGAMPRHLQYRLHNLMIHVGAASMEIKAVLLVPELPDVPDLHTVYILPDGSKQMYIDGVWTAVDMVSGQWVVVT